MQSGLMKLKALILTVAGSTTLLVTLPAASSSTGVSTSPDTLICTQDSAYMKRRLASDQVENLCEAHRGKVMLVVNTASRCAFTGQYEGLEKLYAEYKDKGLVIVGFPSNDFGNQEPGTEKSIKKFCRMTYGVQFPMYEKTTVRGENADPLFKALARASGTSPRWNFHKYLIDRDGRLVDDYSSFTGPGSKTLKNAIDKLL